MKEGDRLLYELKEAARKRDAIELILFAANYVPQWYYWLEWGRLNRN